MITDPGQKKDLKRGYVSESNLRCKVCYELEAKAAVEEAPAATTVTRPLMVHRATVEEAPVTAGAAYISTTVTRQPPWTLAHAPTQQWSIHPGKRMSCVGKT